MAFYQCKSSIFKLKQSRVSSALVVGDEGLEAAVVAGGLEKAIISTMREALSGHAALEELERGTRVRLIAQELTVLGDFARYVSIEALEIDYSGSERKHERIYYFNGPESRGYFDSSGRAPYSGGWRKPIPSAPITSKFNLRRFHPILKRIMPHEGIDFGAPMGTPVGASSYGTVTFVGFAGPTGNFVRLSHPGEIETGYAHLSRFAEGLKVGDKVKRLQVIGYVGSTGRSTGPHLHFSAKRAGKFFDPENAQFRWPAHTRAKGTKSVRANQGRIRPASRSDTNAGTACGTAREARGKHGNRSR